MSYFIEKDFCKKCGKLEVLTKCSTCKKTFCLQCFPDHFSPEEYQRQVAEQTISYYPACFICSGLDHPNHKSMSRFIEKPSETLMIYKNERDYSVHRNCARILQNKVRTHKPLLSREKIVAPGYILVRNGLDVNKVPLMEANI